MDSHCDKDRITYLQMIQGIITRMSNISVTLKGLAVTIFAGALSISMSGCFSRRVTLLSAALVIVALFCWCDCGYLLRERGYRRLYDEVRLGYHECDFDLSVGEFRWRDAWSCLISFSISLYYGALVLVLAIAIFLSFANVI